MAAHLFDPKHVWTVAEAKAKLSELLRLAETQGPQRISAGKSFRVTPERLWQGARRRVTPLVQGLIWNTPCGIEPEVCGSRELAREISFITQEDDVLKRFTHDN